MKLSDINDQTILNISNITLTHLHFKIHQLWVRRLKRKIDIGLLKHAHELIKQEMIKRNLKHNPKILRQHLGKLFSYNEDLE
jgi:hypothetical protein